MDDVDPAGGGTRCAVCGREIETTPRGMPGAPGLGTGSVMDNRPLCKSCQSGRYRARAARRKP